MMINDTLKKAVIDQLGGDQESIDYAKDTIRNCGASGGVGGFIYYYETIKFARDNMNDIYAAIKDMAGELGECPFQMVANFNGLKDNCLSHEVADVIHNKVDEATRNDGVETQILNALSWFALEETINEMECD
tara:strand:+ start:214 stop:612 length:399 start_codon:yes stop_codon:yes gene_type:complete